MELTLKTQSVVLYLNVTNRWHYAKVNWNLHDHSFFFLFYRSKNASNTFLNTLHYTNFKIKKVGFFPIDIPNLVITFCLVLHFIRLTKVKPNEMQKTKALKNINIDIFFEKVSLLQS